MRILFGALFLVGACGKVVQDGAAPDTTIDTGPPSLANTTTAVFTFLSTEPDSTFECRVVPGTFAPCASGDSFSVSSDGANMFEVAARDAAGNLDPSPATYSWTVDSMAPDTMLTAGPAAGALVGAVETFTFTATESGKFECQIDTGGYAPCASPATFTLAQGARTFSVRAVDMAMNADVSPASRAFNVGIFPDSTNNYCCDPPVAGVSCATAPTGQDGNTQILVPAFTVSGGVVTDNVAGLQWEQSINAADITQSAAITYCNNLVLGGASDWRLPSRYEHLTLLNNGRNGPSWNGNVFMGVPPFGTVTWSSTDYAADIAQAWVCSHDDGFMVSQLKTTATAARVRCVRGNTPAPGWTAVGNVVNDSRTGLMWQSGTTANVSTWLTALNACNNLNLDGFSDWRLPSNKELASLVDESRFNPSIAPAFVSRPASQFWTSSAFTRSGSSAFFSEFSNGTGGTNLSFSSGVANVRCVRGP